MEKKRMIKTLMLIACVSAIMLLACMVGAAPFQNGDFESYNAWTAGFASNWNPTGIKGWTVFDSDGQGKPYGVYAIGWDAYAMYGGSPPNYNAIMLRWVYRGGLKQTFDTIAGHLYKVEFVMAGEIDGSTPFRYLLVSAGATQDRFVFDITGKYPWDMGWELNSMTFVADSNQTTLAFDNIGIREWCASAPIIDNVTVTDMGVAPPVVENGSFESIEPGSGPYYGSDSNPDGIIGWLAGAQGGSGTPAGVTRMNVGADGDYSVCLSREYGGSILQSFETKPGHRYRIDFKLAGNPAYAQVNHLDVVANGVSYQFTFDSTGKSLADMGWVQKSVMLDAASTNSTIVFSSTDANFSGPVIDDIVATDIGLAPAPAISISDAKNIPNGMVVQVSGVVTGHVWGGDFYLGSPDRVNGIRVSQAQYYFGGGHNVTLTGWTSTRPSGERQIVLTKIVGQVEGSNLSPLGMTNKAIGGGASGNPPNGQVGITGGVGLNNIGLLVRTTGLVSNSDGYSFNLDDGSGVTLKVVDDFSEEVPEDGQYISVTGVVSCEKVGSDVIPVLMVVNY